MEQNTFEKKAYVWMERCAQADCFTAQNAEIFGHILDYLGNLKGNERKINVAKGVKRIVESVAPIYMQQTTPFDIEHTEYVFQTLLEDLKN